MTQRKHQLAQLVRLETIHPASLITHLRTAHSSRPNQVHHIHARSTDANRRPSTKLGTRFDHNEQPQQRTTTNNHNNNDRPASSCQQLCNNSKAMQQQHPTKEWFF